MLGHVRVGIRTNIEVEPIRWIINLPRKWIKFSAEIYRNQAVFFPRAKQS